MTRGVQQRSLSLCRHCCDRVSIANTGFPGRFASGRRWFATGGEEIEVGHDNDIRVSQVRPCSGIELVEFLLIRRPQRQDLRPQRLDQVGPDRPPRVPELIHAGSRLDRDVFETRISI